MFNITDIERIKFSQCSKYYRERNLFGADHSDHLTILTEDKKNNKLKFLHLQILGVCVSIETTNKAFISGLKVAGLTQAPNLPQSRCHSVLFQNQPHLSLRIRWLSELLSFPAFQKIDVCNNFYSRHLDTEQQINTFFHLTFTRRWFLNLRLSRWYWLLYFHWKKVKSF